MFKTSICILTFLISIPGFSQTFSEKIKVNQLGYILNESKWAYVSDTSTLTLPYWVVKTSLGDTSLFSSTEFGIPIDDESTDEFVYRLDFSDLKRPGSYYIEVDNIGRSYDFEISESPYNKAFEKIVKSFYFQRSGVELTEEFAGKWARPAEYADDAYIYTAYEDFTIQSNDFINTVGGWRDAGDPNKKVVPAAVAVYFLMILYEHFPDDVSQASWNIPDDVTMALPDLLKEIKFTTDWFFKMQDENGAVWHAVTQQDFYLTGMGHEDTNPRYLMPVSTTATANFAASMATAYRIFRDFNQNYADSCLNAAEKAWQALNNESIWNNPYIIGKNGEMQYPESRGYSNDPPGINNTANYNDIDDSDEIYWTAAELFIATGNTAYKKYFDTNLVTGMWYGSRWISIANLANFSYSMASMDEPDATTIELKKSIQAFANIYLDLLYTTGFGVCMRPADYYWGSNHLIGHYAYSFIMFYEILGDEKYKEAALSLLNYLFGANSLNQTFVSGIGDKPVSNIFHLPSRFDGIDEVVPGLIPGGPNQYPSEWDIPHSELIQNENPPPAKCYVDSERSFASNETSLSDQGPWTFVIGYFYKYLIPSTIGIQNNHIDKLKIYPNPASLKVNISITGQYKYMILNYTGQLMKQGKTHNTLKVDVSSWVAGVYFLMLQTENEREIYPFVVY